jgi:hypothetical protein
MMFFYTNVILIGHENRRYLKIKPWKFSKFCELIWINMAGLFLEYIAFTKYEREKSG